MVSERDFAAVKEKTSEASVEIIGRWVSLRKSGQSYKGLCPFHEERTPSFFVKPGGGYRCFGCGASGSVLDFLSHRATGSNFGEAIRLGASLVGYGLDGETRKVDRKLNEWEMKLVAKEFGVEVKSISAHELSGEVGEDRFCVWQRGEVKIGERKSDVLREGVFGGSELLTCIAFGDDAWYRGKVAEEKKLVIGYRVGGELGLSGVIEKRGSVSGVSRLSVDDSWKYLSVSWPMPSDKEIEGYGLSEMPNYVMERGLTEGDYRMWGMGNDVKHKRLVIPIRRYDGVLLGFVKRSYWKESFCYGCGKDLHVDRICGCGLNHAKFYNTPGMLKDKMLFGVDLLNGRGPLLLVEGAFDAIRMRKHGFDAVASLGAMPSSAQLAQVFEMGGGRVLVMGDGDRAGRVMNDVVCGYGLANGWEVKSISLPEGMDPDTIDEERVEEVRHKMFELMDMAPCFER